MNCKTPTFARTVAGLGLVFAAASAQAQLSVFNAPNVSFDVSGNGQWATLASNSGSGGSGVSVWSFAKGQLTDIGGYGGTGGQVMSSADGSVIAGSARDANGRFAASVYRQSSGTWTVLPTLGGFSSATASTAWSISADGRYVGGSAYLGGVSHGFVADSANNTIVDLGLTQARVQGISPGAAILTGYTTSSQNGSMWKRNADGSYTQTTLLNPDAPTNKLAATLAMSSNGDWAVGASFSSGNPYRLNTQTGQVQFFDKLPLLVNGKATVSPASISADGNTIVGIHAPQGALLSQSYGFIWTANGNVTGNTLGGTLMTFDAYLAGLGIDTQNHYDFLSVIGMDDEARVFSGIARDNYTGTQVAFVVAVPVPEPAQYLLLPMGLAAVAVYRRRRA